MIKDNKVYAGTFDILQNGNPLPDYLMLSISEVTVEDKLNEPSLFTIKFKIGDFLKQMASEKIDVDVFQTGDEVKISMGFDQVTYMMVGEISSVEPTFQEPFLLEIRGYDRLFKLTLGAKTMSHEKQKDSDIASKIAQDSGLSAHVEDTAVVYPQVLQNNQSDYRFLLERAQRIGYELLVDDKTLFFRKSQESSAPEQSFFYGEELQQFSIRMKAVPKESKVESRSWDVMNKKEITFTAESSPQQAAARELFPSKGGAKITAPVLDEMVIDATDAEKIATAKYEAIMKDVITGEGKCCGNPTLRAGKTLKIEGIGDRLSGVYYVTSSAHTVSEEGYGTVFRARKTAK